METYEIHPICACVPDMQPYEYSMLLKDITVTGRAREPIVLYEGMILDGRHRYLACRESGKPFVTREFSPKTDGDPVAFVHSRSISRAMKPSQRALMTVRLQVFSDERAAAKGRMAEGGRKGGLNKGGAERHHPSPEPSPDELATGRTREKLAKKTGASARMIDRANKLLTKGHPAMVTAVETGSIALSEAEIYLSMPKLTQARIASEPDRVKRHQRAVNAGTRSRAHKVDREEREVKRPAFKDVFLNQLAHLAERLAFDCNVRTSEEIVTAFAAIEIDNMDVAHRLEYVRPVIDAIVQIEKRLSQPPLRAVK
jgi:hypothetical protein